MFSVELYTFQKKRNSTARPIAGFGTTYTGEIKEDFTPLAFNMIFQFSNAGQIPAYNYAYISDFSRYYYITDWVFVGGLWRGAFTVDVLATYKTQILQTNQFIARAADAIPGGIIDTSYIARGGSARITADQTLTPTEFWGSGYADGTIVIGTICNSGSNVGAVTYYAMGVGGFNNLMRALLDDISWAQISITEISEELQKALINPAQYIVSAIWLPKDAVDFVVNSGAPGSDIVTNIALGWWSFSIASGGNVARILHNPLTTWDYIRVKKYMDIDKHPQSLSAGGAPARPWLQLSPYSRYTLTFLPFGSFDLDTTELYGFNNLGLELRVHAYTGDATLTISAAADDQGTNEKVISVLNANCGVPLPVGQIALNMGNLDSALQSAAIMGATEIAQNIMSEPAVVPAAPTAGKTTKSGGPYTKGSVSKRNTRGLGGSAV